MKVAILNVIRLPIFQSFWERLFKLSVVGMNYWGGSTIRFSGELFLMGFLASELCDKKKPTIFDVGANIGQYVTDLSRFFPDAEIHCFEPSKPTFVKLEQSLNDLPNKENIHLHLLGFGSQVEKKNLFLSNYLASTASVYDGVVAIGDEVAKHTEKIELLTIDAFCELNKIDSIDFLKIDVEGHELHVLQGASRMIQEGKIDHIQFEFTKCNIESKSFFKDFYRILGNSYNLYRMLPSGLRAIETYGNHLEVFAEANFYAQLKK